ncbi:MAG TPA: hypothetical protein VGE30_03710 [Candidatus Saccharimonadales bacterium]
MKRLRQAFIVLSLVAVLASVGSALFGGADVLASRPDPAGPSAPASPASSPCEKPKLLGIFVPWYQYLTLYKDDTGSCTVKDFTLVGNGSDSDVPKVLLAIVDDLLRLAGLVAVIFVIYGAVQYLTSQGEPDAANKARSTIISALVGLVIALVAVAFVSFLGRALTS